MNFYFFWFPRKAGGKDLRIKKFLLSLRAWIFWILKFWNAMVRRPGRKKGSLFSWCLWERLSLCLLRKSVLMLSYLIFVSYEFCMGRGDVKNRGLLGSVGKEKDERNAKKCKIWFLHFLHSIACDNDVRTYACIRTMRSHVHMGTPFCDILRCPQRCPHYFFKYFYRFML